MSTQVSKSVSRRKYAQNNHQRRKEEADDAEPSMNVHPMSRYKSDLGEEQEHPQRKNGAVDMQDAASQRGTKDARKKVRAGEAEPDGT